MSNVADIGVGEEIMGGGAQECGSHRQTSWYADSPEYASDTINVLVNTEVRKKNWALLSRYNAICGSLALSLTCRKLQSHLPQNYPI